MDRVYLSVLALCDGESSKEIIKMAPVKVMKQNYERLYMMTPEEVIGILKENN